MEVLSIRQISLEFSDLARRRPIEIPFAPLSRAPGLHLSDVLRHVAVKIGKLTPGERLEEDYPWRMAMGNMWEEFYFSLHPEYVWQVGEEIVDGIAMNCDGLSMVPELAESPFVLIETKCTECKIVSSAEDLEQKFSKNWWIYQHQARGYCRGYAVDTVVWPMLHYRGDWQGSGPVAMEYTVGFSESEIAQTWEMVKTYRDEMEAER
jgi:hypothetical protein